MNATDERPTEALLDGRYRIGECIGRGGTAAIYRAEDTLLGRTVAVKVLRQSEDMPSAGERVHDETAVLASLNHPSLVTLYDARLDPQQPQFLVMELIDGPTLATTLRRAPLTGLQAASLALDLAEALEFVHDAGIIHRDVKPSNVLLAPSSRREAGWTAKLTDFGIAFSLGDARRTSPGIAIGTAAYMAPEQVTTAELTPAVDIYSLGLLLIEALTGEPAFPVSGGVQTALLRLSEPPTIPDDLGPDWVCLLTRMTRIAPEERPSAEEVAQAASYLRDELSAKNAVGGPLRAPSALAPLAATAHLTGPTREITSALPTPARRTRRRRAPWAAIVGAAAAAAVIVGGIWVLAPSGSLGREAAPASFDGVTDGAPSSTVPADEAEDVAAEDPAVQEPVVQEPAPQPVVEQPAPSTPQEPGPAPVAPPAPPAGGPAEGDGGPAGDEPAPNEGPGGAPNPNKGPGNNSGNQGPSGPDRTES
ncbi:serine/threonine-protein kinase [Microbacterium paludicola]|uniref:serine/threonine-protein kinase n=1 Tax=Microbacterium paludicola TaxID=300019 RepID=UPI0011A2B1E6|nr:serine/threonine-protein kinase [Microbacterium paludicola]